MKICRVKLDCFLVAFNRQDPNADHLIGFSQAVERIRGFWILIRVQFEDLKFHSLVQSVSRLASAGTRMVLREQ